MTYYRGTLEEFNVWHDDVMENEGIALPTGKVGYRKGIAAHDKQHTVAYAKAIAHPVNEDDYIWQYGGYPDATKLSLSTDDVKVSGWLQE